MRTLIRLGLVLALAAGVGCQGDGGSPTGGAARGGKTDSDEPSQGAPAMCIDSLGETLRDLTMEVKAYEGLGEQLDPDVFIGLGEFLDGEGGVSNAYFDSEATSAVFDIDLTEQDDAIKEAEVIGRWVFTALFGAHQVEPAYPCGFVLDGEIRSKLTFDRQTGIETFELKGTGDGGADTCEEGGGGPGSWEHRVTVTVANGGDDDGYATLTIYSGEE
jgi:hypothetical protein